MRKLYHIRRMRPLALALVAAVCVSAAGCAPRSFRETPVVRIIKEWGPSIVNISTERTVLLQQHPNWEKFGAFFDNIYKDQVTRTIGTAKLKGLGSGVVVGPNGLIVTNAHVVNMASKVFVVLSDGGTYEASILAINPRSDVALIKISTDRELKPVNVAKDVVIGETVVSIGNPLGLENSVSVGVISGLDRKITQTGTGEVVFNNVIQTDASINVGSSGGALLNLDGELVGINLAVVQGAQNLGFAIGYDKIRGVLDDYNGYLDKKKKLGSRGQGPGSGAEKEE